MIAAMTGSWSYTITISSTSVGTNAVTIWGDNPQRTRFDTASTSVFTATPSYRREPSLGARWLREWAEAMRRTEAFRASKALAVDHSQAALAAPTEPETKTITTRRARSLSARRSARLSRRARRLMHRGLRRQRPNPTRRGPTRPHFANG